MQGGFIQSHVASFYKESFEKPLTLDVIEDSLSFIRTGKDGQYIYLKFTDSYDSLTSLETDCSYSIDIELRGVFVKTSKIHLDWKLIQIGMEEPMIQSRTDDYDYDDDESDDVAYPSGQELEAAKDAMILTLQNHVADLENTVANAQSTLVVLKGLLHDLEKTDRSLEAICKVYDDMEKINLART